MENITHIVQKEETLEIIAKKYNISVKEMVTYHNKNCGVTELITNNTLSKYQRHIYIKSAPPKKEKLFIDSKVIQKPFIYDITICQKLVANSVCLVDTETKSNWKYTILRIDKSRIIAKVELGCQKIKNQVIGVEKLLDFCTLFNIPIENLIVELDVNGKFQKIINQQEILDKWKILRADVLASYQEDDAMKGIFIAGDTQFSNTLMMLRSSLLHFLFFDNVYEKQLTENICRDEKCSFLSNLFQGLEIPFIKQQRTIVNEPYFCTQNKLAFIDEAKLNLRDKYNVSYKEITGKEFNYNFEITSKANYLIENGVLQNLDIMSIEKANERLCYQIRYVVNLKTEDI